jgi:hypothetical protein
MIVLKNPAAAAPRMCAGPELRSRVIGTPASSNRDCLRAWDELGELPSITKGLPTLI